MAHPLCKDTSLKLSPYVTSLVYMKDLVLLRSSPPLAFLTLLALAFAGCGDVEDTNPDSAACTLVPNATFAVTQDPPPLDSVVATTNVVNGVTNIQTTITPATSITTLSLSSASAGGGDWTVQAGANTGESWPGVARGPTLYEPTGDNTFPAGAAIASFSLQCAGLSGEITAVARVPIPLDVVRTSTTNGTNVVIGRHGQHVLTPANTRYHLVATLSSGDGPTTLTGSAPAPAATIIW